MMKSVIPDQFWDSERSRYNSHRFFDTINHHHISDYSGDESCDLMIVECRDGRWYVEDNWGGDAKGAEGVFNPFEKGSYPTFFPTLEAANLHAAEVVSSITGTPVAALLLEDESS